MAKFESKFVTDTIDFSQIINKLEQVPVGYGPENYSSEDGFTVKSCNDAEKWLKSFCENHANDELMNKLYKDYKNAESAIGQAEINIHINSFSVAALFKYIRHMFALVSREDRQVVLNHLINLHYYRALSFITGEAEGVDYELKQSYTMVRYIVELEYRYSKENQTNKFDALATTEVPNTAVGKKVPTDQ